jgi:hypothetical protein
VVAIIEISTFINAGAHAFVVFVTALDLSYAE